jgi:hypothetical protein
MGYLVYRAPTLLLGKLTESTMTKNCNDLKLYPEVRLPLCRRDRGFLFCSVRTFQYGQDKTSDAENDQAILRH